MTFIFVYQILNSKRTDFFSWTSLLDIFSMWKKLKPQSLPGNLIIDLEVLERTYETRVQA